MTNFTFTRETLENMTVPALRTLCVNELAIPGMTKKAKGIIIDAILEKYGKPVVEAPVEQVDVESTNVDPYEGLTVPELRAMCVDKGIVGMSKKRRDIVINALNEFDGIMNGNVETNQSTGSSPKTAMVGLEGDFTSILTNTNASSGNKTTTTINISSGASSGEFPVIGRTVGEVSEFLREVLNVDRMSKGIVNGKEVESSYVLKEGDRVEFLKPAGKKGLN